MNSLAGITGPFWPKLAGCTTDEDVLDEEPPVRNGVLRVLRTGAPWGEPASP